MFYGFRRVHMGFFLRGTGGVECGSITLGFSQWLKNLMDFLAIQCKALTFYPIVEGDIRPSPCMSRAGLRSAQTVETNTNLGLPLSEKQLFWFFWTFFPSSLSVAVPSGIAEQRKVKEKVRVRVLAAHLYRARHHICKHGATYFCGTVQNVFRD